MNRSIKTGLLRLRHLREVHEAVDETMIAERARFAALAKREPVKAVSAFNLFQTPREVAKRMAEILGPTDGQRGLEPSAGLARLVTAVRADDITMVENSPTCCEYLYGLIGGRLIQDDFLSCDAERLGGLFDFVIMNPPFKLGRDIKHIRHAFELLKPGGRLVALCFDGVRQNRDLRPLVDTWEVLPAASFRSEGTTASVAMITWRKYDKPIIHPCERHNVRRETRAG